MRGKNVIVTGSTSGIGRGIARAFARAGANVALNGSRPAAQMATVVDEWQSEFGVKVTYVAADLTDPRAVRMLATAAQEALGTIDIVVNNAGIQHVAPIEDFPTTKWDAIIALNLSAAFHLIGAVVPDMKERGWGRIINVASAHALRASPFKSAYVTAKHGLLGLSKTVAMETAEYGITCNSICPGYVRTPLVEKQIADQARTHDIPEEDVVRNIMLAQHQRKEFVTIDELAAMALFLASEDAASITGTAIAIDGGWTQH